MKINVAKSAGFCSGVKRAIKIALETVSKNKNIEMLGDIVHNEDVVRQINNLGIKKVRKLSKDSDKTLLIRAHGSPLRNYIKALKLGYKIVDATCPMVKEIHKIVIEHENIGYKIIVIGDRKHEEVKGIVGQIKNKAIVIEKKIPIEKIKKIKKACIVVQSTQNLTKVLAIIGVLKKYIKDLRFFNTICYPTRTKQQEIKILPLKNDIMIIIGSKKSANTKRLYEISKSLNKKSYWIQSKNDLKFGWFKGVKKVGITAGASTPDSTTKEIIKSIKNIS